MTDETYQQLGKTLWATAHDFAARERWLYNSIETGVDNRRAALQHHDKTNDPKVTGYQLAVIDQSKQEKKIVKFIPADTPKISCKDAGADHEGLWAVTVQSCYDKSTCGSPTDVARMRITAK